MPDYQTDNEYSTSSIELAAVLYYLGIEPMRIDVLNNPRLNRKRAVFVFYKEKAEDPSKEFYDGRLAVQDAYKYSQSIRSCKKLVGEAIEAMP